jgi:hypothetical protein
MQKREQKRDLPDFMYGPHFVGNYRGNGSEEFVVSLKQMRTAIRRLKHSTNENFRANALKTLQGQQSLLQHEGNTPLRDLRGRYYEMLEISPEVRHQQRENVLNFVQTVLAEHAPARPGRPSATPPAGATL